MNSTLYPHPERHDSVENRVNKRLGELARDVHYLIYVVGLQHSGLVEEIAVEDAQSAVPRSAVESSIASMPRGIVPETALAREDLTTASDYTDNHLNVDAIRQQIDAAYQFGQQPEQRSSHNYDL